MHLNRSTKNCKEIYGAEFDSIKKKQQKQRKKYLRKKNAEYYSENGEVINEKKRKKNWDNLMEQCKAEAEVRNSRKEIEQNSDEESDDFEIQTLNKRKEKEKKYNKEYYKKISKEKKAAYDPTERRSKYLKEKDRDSKTAKRICDSELDSDESDKEVERFLERDEYKKQYYKKNSEKIKKKQIESYDPSERRKKYQNEKKVKAKLIEKICSDATDDQLSKDKEVCIFLNKDEKEKLYKKDWYKKNSERIKTKQLKNYDPSKRQKQYKKVKAEKEENTKKWYREKAVESRASSNKDVEKVARDRNKAKKVQASIPNCYGCKGIIKMNMPGTVEKVKEIDEEIEALYQKIELEIDGIVEEGQKLNNLASHETLYRKLYLRCPPAAGSKLSNCI